MRGDTGFSKLDVFAKYWKVELAEHVLQKAAFRCKYGIYQFQVMPFGLLNKSAIFQ